MTAELETGYLEKTTKLLHQVRPRLAATHNLEFKNVFGAVAGYVNGNIFISTGRFGVALKLPAETVEILLKEEGVKRLKYFSKGRIKKNYVVLPSLITENRDRFKRLVNESIRYALN